MTCDERLEALLNRAGQTISDLPNAYTMREHEELKRVLNMATQWFAQEDYPDRVRVDLATLPLFQYIMHQADVIDRLEWALDKTLREKAYLRAKCCYFCGLEGDNQTPETCEECDVGKGVPEDWSADDD